MKDFLLELRSEEIPARMQAGARAELEKLFRREMASAGIDVGDVTVWSTPRRLALIARGLPDATAAVSEEAKGPPQGAPDAAMDGFLRKTGVTKDQLQLRDVKGRQTWFAVIDKPGRATAEVLADAIPAIIRDFAWPKSMRWGAASFSTESVRWVRPLSGIVALLGEDVVDCEVHGVTSGAVTLGHRFHHRGDITIGNAGDYAMKLRAGHVIVDHEERAALVREGAAKAAADADLTLVADEGLVIENAGLTEWPVPLLGRFDEAFLDVPPEVIQLTARVNQKYFVCHDSAGKLANAFVCTANIAAEDGGAAIVEGNRKVLAARLSDARFFWEQDRKNWKLFNPKLSQIKFYEGLGTLAEKQYRVEFFLDRIEFDRKATDLIGITRIGALSKIDLVSGTVGEFPELQGVIGAYLIADDEYTRDNAPALKAMYFNASQIENAKPSRGENLLQIADKLTDVISFAAIGVWFKGSGDPLGIKQSIQAIIAAILKSELRLPLNHLIEEAYQSLVISLAMHRDIVAVETLTSSAGQIREIETPIFGAGIPDANSLQMEDFYDSPLRAKPASREGMLANGFVDWALERNLRDYGDLLYRIEPFSSVSKKVLLAFVDRLKVQQREAGVRHDLIDAVFALGGEDDLVRLLARVHALQSFVGTADGTNLLAGYKRAANIIKKENWSATVTPAQAGAQGGAATAEGDSRLRGNDDHQGIARTGEEDPLALVDDPDMTAVIRAKLDEQKNRPLSYTPEPAEAALIAALDSAEPQASAAVEAEDFAGAMRALASLRAPIDAFFTEVTVNDPDPDKRKARLDLLLRLRDAVHRVADFSRIEG